jgi:hypothetical protein
MRRPEAGIALTLLRLGRALLDVGGHDAGVKVGALLVALRQLGGQPRLDEREQPGRGSEARVDLLGSFQRHAARQDTVGGGQQRTVSTTGPEIKR